MAERSDAPFAPSQRRLQRARREGQSPHSAVLTGWAVLLVALLVAFGGAGLAMLRLRSLMRAALDRAFSGEPLDTAASLAFYDQAANAAFGLWWPVSVAALGAAALVALVQSRGALRPLRLASARDRRGGSLAGALGVAGALLGGAALVWQARGAAMALARTVGAGALLSGAGRLTEWLLLRLFVVLALWAGLDVFWQWWRWRQNLRMSVRERKDEERLVEGDPRQRAERRRVGRTLLAEDRGSST